MERSTLLIGIGVLAFGITLGIVVGMQLQTELAQMVGLAVAVGVVVGLLTGAISARLLNRSSPSGGQEQEVTISGLMLTDEQTDALYTLLEGGTVPQASGGSFTPGPRVRRHRDYQAVGGAELPTTDE